MSTTSKRTSSRLGSGTFGRLSGFANPEDLLQCLASYYNGTSFEIGDSVYRSANFVKLLGGLDYSRFGGTERLAVILLLESEGWGVLPMRMPRAQRRETDIRRIARELDEHQQEFRGAVKWLCTTKPETDLVRRFERGLTATGKIGRYPDIDRRSENYIKYFEEHGLRHMHRRLMLLDGRLWFHLVCAHWVDLFCGFILSECIGKSPDKMPFRLCRHCEKLFSPPHPNVEFCGTNCQRKNFWTDERHRDYEFVRRQLEYSQKDLHAKMDKHTYKERLAAIKLRWPDWPKILKMVQSIEQHAARHKGGKA